MKFGSLDGVEDGDYNGIGFVGIGTVVAMLEAFFLWNDFIWWSMR